ncbi:MAG TPA: hypothetical protein VFB77_17100 [Acidimicrobiales bacterium]|nr:hypothetical protein [Acidimicrobiales bacterium]
MTDAPTPVPEDQLPGHHPDVDQDKPDPARLPPGTERRFAFVFDPVNLALGAPFGVTPWTSDVRVTSRDLIVRYGPWTLRTPVANVAGTEETGPYDLVKIAGPPRVSLADRGISFATRTVGGLCICFREPVPAVLPLHLGLVKHPAATVTVEGAGELARLLEG